MSLQVVCDGPKCDKTCPENMYINWIKCEDNRPADILSGNRLRHYCSYKCEHDHTYLLISGDNGK